MALLNDQEVYHECKGQTKSIHAKVFKQLLELKTPLDQNLRINTSISAFQVTKALLPDSMVDQNSFKPIPLSD